MPDPREARDEITGGSWLDDLARASLSAVAGKDSPAIVSPGNAIARVRALHVRSGNPVVTRHLCSRHGARRGASGWNLPDRAEISACPDCTVTERYVCQHCRHACPDDDNWPCATTRALEDS